MLVLRLRGFHVHLVVFLLSIVPPCGRAQPVPPAEASPVVPTPTRGTTSTASVHATVVKVVPSVFNGDVRSLPLSRPWYPGDPIITRPPRRMNATTEATRTTNVTGPGGTPPVLDDGTPRLPGDFPPDDVTPLAFSPPDLDIDGMPFMGALPPDPVGDIGLHHYIQMVNHYDATSGDDGALVTIHDKSGVVQAGPFDLDDMWTGGGPCEDSAVEVTTTVQNMASAEARVGVQCAWNIGMVGGGAAALAPIPGQASFTLWESREGEWTYPLFDHLLASWTNAPWMIEPYYFGGIAVNGPWPLNPPPTPPDAIVRGADWTGAPPGGPGNTCFAWEAPDPPRGGPPTPGAGGNESLVYYWGRTEDTAIHLAPGESRSFTTWFWAFLDNPVTCDAGDPHQVVECAGPITSVQLDGSSSFTADGNPLQYRWSSSDPAVTFDDATAERPIARLPGLGTFPITLDVGIGPFTQSCSTEVEVIDTTAPVFRALTVDPAILWPPNHRLVDLHVNAEIEDNCSASPTLKLVGVRSSEPDDATGLGDGNTTGDIQRFELGRDDRDVLLRAERDGNGTGRVYTLTYEASDEAGNTSTGVLLVRVPRDMRGGGARLLPPRSMSRRR